MPAVTASASDINLFFTLGRLYLRTNDNAKVIQALQRVVSLNPGSVQGRLTLAQAYIAANNLEGAITSLEEAAEDDPRVAATLGQYLEQARTANADTIDVGQQLVAAFILFDVENDIAASLKRSQIAHIQVFDVGPEVADIPSRNELRLLRQDYRLAVA